LADSTLNGGVATPAGSFAFTTPSTVPPAGTAPQSVTYTPTDTANYTMVVGNVDVTVNPLVPSVSFTESSQAVAENAGIATITAALSGVSNVQVTVPFTVAGTASNPEDYTITGSPLTIPAGEISAVISISIVDDTSDESEETVVVTMGTPTNAAPAAPTEHTVTMTDNDEPADLDTDEDGLPDWFEDLIIDAKPGDHLETYADVTPSDSFARDGHSNLLKYAFGMNPVTSDNTRHGLGTASPGLPYVAYERTPEGGKVVVEYLRRTNGKLSYLPEKSGTLGNNSWSSLAATPLIEAVDADWERVRYEEPYDPVLTHRLFVRVRVTTLTPRVTLIPAGNLQIGHASNEGSTAGLPVHAVDLSKLPMDTYRNVIGLDANMKISAALNSWQTVTPDETVKVGTDPITEALLIETRIKMGAGSKVFARLKITEQLP